MELVITDARKTETQQGDWNLKEGITRLNLRFDDSNEMEMEDVSRVPISLRREGSENLKICVEPRVLLGAWDDVLIFRLLREV